MLPVSLWPAVPQSDDLGATGDINPVAKSYNFVKSCQIIEAYFQLKNEEHQRVLSKI